MFNSIYSFNGIRSLGITVNKFSRSLKLLSYRFLQDFNNYFSSYIHRIDSLQEVFNLLVGNIYPVTNFKQSSEILQTQIAYSSVPLLNQMREVNSSNSILRLSSIQQFKYRLFSASLHGFHLRGNGGLFMQCPVIQIQLIQTIDQFYYTNMVSITRVNGDFIVFPSSL